MKIGILTFHCTQNYGAVLQCYALQETLKSLGYEVFVIDYIPESVTDCYKIISLRRIREIKGNFRILQGYLRRIPIRISKKKSFAEFCKKYLHLTKPCKSPDNLPPMDVYIVGSDQMWNFNITQGIDPVYTGQFNKSTSSNLIGYAISTNLRSLQSLTDGELKTICNNFTYISFREQDFAQIASKRTGRKIDVDIDPTLLMESEFWNKLTTQRFANRRYVLLYQVRKPNKNRRLLNRKAKHIAKMKHCEVIDVSNAKYSPEDFVSLFRYAMCVVTSSFHATVFSLIFERPLYAVCLRDGSDARYENLLKSIGAGNLLVDNKFEPRSSCFDYTVTHSRLNELRVQSLCHLKDTLLNIERKNRS